jgi:acetyl esterase/lipase
VIGRRPGFAGMVVRALLAALSLIILLPASFAVLGAFFPYAPAVGPFYGIVNLGLPWVVGALVVSTAVAAAIVALGGRKARILLVVNAVILVGSLYIGYRYIAVAGEHGATYDPIRAADGYPPIGDADQTVVFTTVDSEDLQAGIWLPPGADSAAPATLGAVLFVHGGAFQGGGLWTRPMLMEALEREGIVGIDIEYRLAPPPRWQDAPGDVLCALAWMRTAPEVAMVDPSRVLIVGESAGGNLAMVAGYAAGTEAIASSCPEAGAPVVPVGVVAIAPTADLVGIWNDRTIFDYAGTQFPEAYIGGPPAEFPDRYTAAEPFRLVRPDLPPTLLVVAENDRFVEMDRQHSTFERVGQSGARIQMIVVPFVGHGFDGQPNSYGAQLMEQLVPAFLRSLP